MRRVRPSHRLLPHHEERIDFHLIRDVAIWAICLSAIVGVLARPFGIGEWVWALGGAVLVTLTGLLPFRAAGAAVGEGLDVYLFLSGMMLLSETARREGVFAWIAAVAVKASGGSRMRLFAIVYGVGVVVTTVLSNDATAVVLTPAVAAAVKAAKAKPLPYLFACALIANAASFILPISNPANLVVFAGGMPPLGAWLASFALPSLASVAITYVVMLVLFRGDLAGDLESDVERKPLARGGVVTLAGIGLTACALVASSAFGANLGTVTAIAGALVFAIVACMDRAAARPIVASVSWSVLVLVAGLFVLASAVEETGVLTLLEHATVVAAAWPRPFALAAAAFATGIGSNLVNNLPSGLIAGSTVGAVHVDAAFRSAVAIGIDLGPNLSVTGSLATILWLLALRREDVAVDAWHFLRVGAVAMPLALIGAVACLLLHAR
jgi:arsenical pump membrane protein